jgi:hypothetical protein
MEKTINIIIKELREQIAREIESVNLDGTSQLNGLGMKIIAAKIARNIKP